MISVQQNDSTFSISARATRPQILRPPFWGAVFALQAAADRIGCAATAGV